jgi:hypothetical protein
MNTLQMFLEVFPPDGWNKETGVLNRDDTHTNAVKVPFATSRLTLAAVFLGLPHRLLDPAQKQSVLNMVKNFFGWRDTVSTFKNIITMPFMTVMNIVLTPLKLLINIAKLSTEFLPLYLEQKIDKASKFFYEAFNAETGFTSAALLLLAGTFYLGSLSFSLAYVLGRAITSPNVSARKGYKLGAGMGNMLLNVPPNQETVLGMILGGIGGLLSLFISVTLYALVLPLGLQFIGAKVLPHLPGVISSFIDSAGSALAPFFNVMAKVTQFFSFDLYPLVLAYSNAAIAIAGITAISTTTLGYQARELSSKFKAWWHMPTSDYLAPAEINSNEPASSASADTTPVVSDLLKDSTPTSSKGFAPDVSFSPARAPATSTLSSGSVFRTAAPVATKVEQQETAGNRM